MLKLIVCFGMALTACGGEAGDANKPRSSGEASGKKAIDCRQDLELTDDAPAADKELRRVPANDLKVLAGGEEKALCDLVKEHGGQSLTVFQFVSTKCYSCLKWAESTGAASAKYQDVLPVVVVTDTVDELSDEEMAQLQQDVAAGSIWVRDVDRSLWQFFSTGEDPMAATSPLTILMDYAARGFALTDPTATLANFVEWANAEMELAITATP